jgi:hypothetical protein
MTLNALPCLTPYSQATHVPPSCGPNASAQTWSPSEQVVLDLDLPHIAIARALRCADDAAIWREYARSRDQDDFLDVLGRLAGSYHTTQTHFRDPSRTTQWQHELVAVPFLLPATSWPIAGPAAPDRTGAGSLMGELQQWAGHEQPARLLLGCVNYVDLCAWSPVTQQEYLQLLAGEQRAISPASAVGARIPAGVVQLAFAIGSVRCWNAPPFIPECSPSTPQWDLRARLAACLSYTNQCHIRPEHVLAPALLRDAVADGLRLWTNELSEHADVSAWDVRIGMKDLVFLELAASNEEPDRIALPLRRHQLGGSGLPTLMADLARQLPAHTPEGGGAGLHRPENMH